MSVEERVEASFRALLEAKPYKKMTVGEICEGAGIARKTFYAHFKDKESVIDYIFRRDIIAPQREMRRHLPHEYSRENPELFNQRIYELVLDDRDLYYKLVGPLKGVDDTFLRVATWAIYDLDLDILKEGANFTSDWELDYTAYFFSSSQAMLMQKWISDGMKVPPADLAKLYTKFIISFWADR